MTESDIGIAEKFNAVVYAFNTSLPANLQAANNIQSNLSLYLLCKKQGLEPSWDRLDLDSIVKNIQIRHSSKYRIRPARYSRSGFDVTLNVVLLLKKDKIYMMLLLYFKCLDPVAGVSGVRPEMNIQTIPTIYILQKNKYCLLFIRR